MLCEQHRAHAPRANRFSGEGVAILMQKWYEFELWLAVVIQWPWSDALTLLTLFAQIREVAFGAKSEQLDFVERPMKFNHHRRTASASVLAQTFANI
jgi:hypothetical protein